MAIKPVSDSNLSGHDRDGDIGFSSEYVRLNLVDVKLWQFIAIVVLIMTTSLLVFPRHKILVSFYLQKGMHKEALAVVNKMMEKTPDDAELLLFYADIKNTEGEIDKAIGALERAAKGNPEDLKILSKLATFYEWGRRPREALPVWEKIAGLDPNDVKALRRVNDFYRYYGNSEKEAAFVARVIDAEKGLSPARLFDSISEGTVRDRVGKDLLYRALTRELQSITRRTQSGEEDPYLKALLVRLYYVRMNYVRGFDVSEEGNRFNMEATVLRSMELFVMTDHLARGRAFAEHLDKASKGVRYRLALAKVMLWNGLIEPAATLLTDLHKAFPGNIQVLVRLAAVSKQKKALKDAIAAYERLVKTKPENREYQSELAELYLADGGFREAYPLFRELAEAFQGEEPRVQRMLYAAELTKDPALLEEAVSRALALRPGDRDILDSVINAYLGMNRPDRAYAQVRDILQARGENLQYGRKMLDLAGFTGNPVIIAEAVRLAQKRYPGVPAIQRKVAEMLLGAGNEGEAIKAYQAYLVSRPGDAKAQKKLADLYLWNGQPQKALALQLALARKKPGNKAAWLAAAQTAEQAGLSEDAYHLYKDLHKKYPEDRDIRTSLIRAASFSNRPEEVAPLLAEISDKDPQDFEKALNAGDAFVDADRLRQGLVYLERAFLLNPNDLSLRKKLAKYYQWAGLSDKMIAQLEHLHAQGALEKDQVIVLAQAYMDKKQGEKALILLEPYQKEKKLPQREGTMLAIAYALAGKDDTAISVYKRLAQENAEDPQLLASLGNQALWLSQTGPALQFYEMALKKDPKNLIALKGSAQIYAWNNNPKGAIQRFEEYNRYNSNDYEVRYQLGELYFENERQGEAFNEYRRVLALIKKVQGLQAKKDSRARKEPR